MKFNYKEAIYRPELCASALYHNIWSHIDEHIAAIESKGYEVVGFRSPKKGETCLGRSGIIFTTDEDYAVDVAFFILQKVITDTERLDFLLQKGLVFVSSDLGMGLNFNFKHRDHIDLMINRKRKGN